jgi:hypothetical protein
MQSLKSLLTVICLVMLAGAAHGQVATALVFEGQPLAGAPDYTVSSINNAAVTGADGWAFTVNTLGADDIVSVAYGTFGVAAPDVLAEEQVTLEYQQDSWESFFGLADDGVAYSPSCTRIADGVTGLDSVWLDDQIVAIEEMVYPHEAGYWFSFGSRPDATRDGVPYFVGGITDEQGGSTDNRGLFYGWDTQPLVIGGMMIPGLPDPVVFGSAAVSFDYRVSAYGAHWIAEIATDTGSSANDGAMLYDGELLMAGGLPVVEGGAVPESIGGLAGENWDNFDFCGVTEDGQWLLTGDTDYSDTLLDEIVVVNGVIVLREGDLVDGMPLNGSIEGGYMNEQGDWAVIWDVDTADANVEVLILNGSIVLMEGMPVDVDGDGVWDDGTAVADFTGISSLVLADRDAQGRARAYFTADCEVPGAAPVAGQVDLPADERLGLDEPYVAEETSRAVIELGLVLAPEGVVSIDPQDDGDGQTPPARLALEQNHPNPFNPQTTIAFSLDRAGHARLDVFDVQGRLVRTLADGDRAAGPHTVTWRGVDAAGRAVPAGAYVYRLTTDTRVLNRTMTLVK